MKAKFIMLEEHKVKEKPRPEEQKQQVDIARIVQRARLKAQQERAEWEALQATLKEKPANPYEALSDEELLVLAGEELTTDQMKALLRERQLRARRRQRT